MQIGSTTQVESHLHESLVHRQQGCAITADAYLVSEGFGKTFTKDYGRIFDRMMRVDLEVPPHIDLEVKQAVPAEQREHMVEEWDSRFD
jgi:hypothetical protein